MPGQHPEGSVGDCIASVLDDNPDLDEESAARICHAQLMLDLDDGQKATLIEIEQAIAELDDTDRARALGQRLGQKLKQAREGDIGQKAIAAGQHAPVRPAPVEPARISKVDLSHLDADNPPEEFADALAADSFVLYGKASIQKFDRGGEKSDTREVLDLSTENVDNALARFFDSKKAPGIISIGHDDIPVGRPLREYTLDEATTIEVGGDVFEFDAGETLSTHVEDGDSDGRPELWMLADLANETPLHRKVRLAALLGELDGFSVTFGRNETDREGHGRKVTQWDLYSVTLAPSDMVAVEGAEFDLAAFKALFDGPPDPAEQTIAEAEAELRETIADLLD